MYETAGRLMAYSVVHREPLPSFLSQSMYAFAFLSHGSNAPNPSVADVDDDGLRRHLNDVSIINLSTKLSCCLGK